MISLTLGRRLIANMNGMNYTLKRSIGGSYVDGVWVDEAQAPEDGVPTQVFGSLQPITGRELARFPEGDRSKQRYKLYCADLLKTSNELNQANADVVVINGEDFQVESVEPWTNFYKAIIVKVEQI